MLNPVCDAAKDDPSINQDLFRWPRANVERIRSAEAALDTQLFACLTCGCQSLLLPCLSLPCLESRSPRVANLGHEFLGRICFSVMPGRLGWQALLTLPQPRPLMPHPGAR